MFGMSGTELIIILVLALLLLGPEKLPEMAKLAGKTMREFEKATNDVRGTVERELHRLEQEADLPAPPPAATPAATVVELKPVPQPVVAPPPAATLTSTSDIDLSANVIPMDRRPPKNEGPA